ncbi:MAG: recombination protein RecR [Anaerolineaceae bacterium]|nr:recombination protein RecR [Anaerolineaceae bacterium]MBN2676960.1 recombination protein RecR [Anaerolineaceae bacterium]
MPSLPEPLQNLVESFERLPGIGPKTAARLAFFLFNAPEPVARNLVESLQSVKQDLGFCSACFNITLATNPLCEICSDESRNSTSLCIVEEPLDVLALERTNAYHGLYHVLHGVLSPIDGIGPDDLKIQPLLERMRIGKIKEVILATNPSMEGDATALFLQQQLLTFGIKITRLARGLPVGSDLEYADQNTLSRALSGRQEMTG